MKRFDFISKLTALVFVLAVLLACGTLSPRVKATPTATTAPTRSIATATETLAETGSAGLLPTIRQPQSTGDSNYIEIPSTSDVPPSDLIQQVAFSGSGGGEGSDAGCAENCLNINVPDGVLSFFGFVPNQQVRLVIYDDSNMGMFLTEVLIEVDNNGEYVLHLDFGNKHLGFFVYDLKGNVIFKPRAWNDHSMFDDNCPGIRRTRLEAGMKAITLVESQEVRSEPGEYNGSVVATLEKGTQVKIVDGPECLEVQARVWWKINTGNGDSGWVPEADYSWFLEPLP